MRSSGIQFARTLLIVLLAASFGIAAPKQRGGKGRAGSGQPHERRNALVNPEKKQQNEMRKMMGLPPHWMERLQDMTPEAQERFLANNEHFKNLPPERQAQIRRRLLHWNSMTPEQRQAFRGRERVWEQLTPEQKRYVQEDLLPKWQQVQPERRKVLLQKLHTLRNLSDAERAAKLNDPAFVNGLSPDEQVMLRDLSNLRVGSAPEPPQDNP